MMRFSAETLERVRWQDEALCSTTDPEKFFAKADVRTKQRCQDCPVREQCLEFALLHGHVGIWGGTTTRERREIQRRRRAEAS